MKIGIDISQVAYNGTGVASFMKNLVKKLAQTDKQNEYILFFSSLRGKLDPEFINNLQNPKFRVNRFFFPELLLDILWNRLHIFPIEWFVGDIDIFISSDWTQPPTKHAKKATILYDLIIYKYPEETAKRIIDVQKRRLKWVKKEIDGVICISEATKNDAEQILNISADKVAVIYPGI